MDPMVVPTVDGSQIPKVSQHIPRSFGNGNFPHLPGGFGWTDLDGGSRGSQNTLTFDCNYTPEIWQTAPQHSHALPETNMAPENRSSQKETSIPTIHFHVRAVSFREGSWEEKLTFFQSIMFGIPFVQFYGCSLSAVCTESALSKDIELQPRHRILPRNGLSAKFLDEPL